MQVLAGQVALITGAASGIGLGLAEAFARRGLKLVLADIDQAGLDRIAHEFAATGVDVLALQTDVSDGADMMALREAALERFGSVDILCNNAGIVSPFRPMWENPLEDWERVMGVDLWGVIHGIREFVPAMVAAGRGHVLNTASVAGLIVIPANGIYNAAKKAVVSLSETLQADLAAAGADIGVTVLCPGLVRTAINSDPAIEALLPEGAVFLTPAEAAEQAIIAIERGQLYLATHPGTDLMVDEYQSRVLQEIAQVPPTGAVEEFA